MKEKQGGKKSNTRFSPELIAFAESLRALLLKHGLEKAGDSRWLRANLSDAFPTMRREINLICACAQEGLSRNILTLGDVPPDSIISQWASVLVTNCGIEEVTATWVVSVFAYALFGNIFFLNDKVEVSNEPNDRRISKIKQNEIKSLRKKLLAGKISETLFYQLRQEILEEAEETESVISKTPNSTEKQSKNRCHHCNKAISSSYSVCKSCKAIICDDCLIVEKKYSGFAYFHSPPVMCDYCKVSPTSTNACLKCGSEFCDICGKNMYCPVCQSILRALLKKCPICKEIIHKSPIDY